MPSNSPLLVVGASGYLGSITVREAVADGAEVAEWRSSSEDQQAWLRRIRLGEFRAVINTAATTYREPEHTFLGRYWESNVDLPARIAQAAQVSGTTLIQVGTRWSLGASGEGPNSLYGATKQLGELLATSFKPAKMDGDTECGRVFIVRVRDIMGPGDRRATVAHALREASQTRTPLDMTPGDQLIDPIDARDVACALLSLASNAGIAQATAPYTEIGLHPISVRQFVDEWQEATGLQTQVRWGAKPYRGTECFTMDRVHPMLSTFTPRARHETLRATLDSIIQGPALQRVQT